MGDRRVALGFGQRFQAEALGFGGLAHCGLQLPLAARDLLLLQLDLLAPLDDFDFHLLAADFLLGAGALQFIGQLGLGAARVDLLVVGGFLHAVAALGFGDLGIGFVPRGFFFAQGLGGADAGVALRLGFADRRVAPHLSRAAHAQRVEITARILDVADGEGDDFQSHAGQVGRGDAAHLRGELLAIAVDFLDGQRAEDGALVTFERLQRHIDDFGVALAEELLRGGADRFFAARHLDLGHAVD